MTPRGGATFASARDAWIVVAVWASAAVCLAAAVVGVAEPAPLEARLVVLAVLGSAGVVALWVLYGTAYALAPDGLRIRSGPFRYHLPYEEIDEVVPSRSPLSSPALSLRRLRIRYRHRRRSVLVSPADREGFLAALAARCPALERAGDVLRRTPAGETDPRPGPAEPDARA